MIRGSNTLSTIRPCDKRPDPCNAETRPDRRRKMATEGPVDQIRQGAMGLRRGVCKIRQQVWIDVSEAQYYLSIYPSSFKRYRHCDLRPRLSMVVEASSTKLPHRVSQGRKQKPDRRNGLLSVSAHALAFRIEFRNRPNRGARYQCIFAMIVASKQIRCLSHL